jgi:hypothetical protein
MLPFQPYVQKIEQFMYCKDPHGPGEYAWLGNGAVVSAPGAEKNHSENNNKTEIS